MAAHASIPIRRRERERGRDLISDYVTRQTQHLILSSGFPDTHTLPVSSSRGALPGLEDKTNQTGLYRASPYTGPIVIQKKSKETQPYSSSTPGQKWPNSQSKASQKWPSDHSEPSQNQTRIRTIPKTSPKTDQNHSKKKTIPHGNQVNNPSIRTILQKQPSCQLKPVE